VVGNCVSKGSDFRAMASSDKGTPALALYNVRPDQSSALKIGWMKSPGKWQVSGDLFPSMHIDVLNRRAMAVLPAGAGWPETVVLAVYGYPLGKVDKAATYLVAYAPSTGKAWAQKVSDVKYPDNYEMERSGTTLILGGCGGWAGGQAGRWVLAPNPLFKSSQGCHGFSGLAATSAWTCRARRWLTAKHTRGIRPPP